MSNVLGNTIASKGVRVPIQVDVGEDAVEVSAVNDERSVLVLYNLGPDTVWAGPTAESATPELGFPILANGGLVESDSIDAWWLGTAEGDSADIRGWEVSRP